MELLELKLVLLRNFFMLDDKILIVGLPLFSVAGNSFYFHAQLFNFFLLLVLNLHLLVELLNLTCMLCLKILQLLF